MRKRQYRTVWIDIDDWNYLLLVGRACGLSASLLTAQSVAALVERLRAEGLDDLLAAAASGVNVVEVVREKVAATMQAVGVELGKVHK